jgi:glucosyl-3-phosphoglycerate synthase
MAFAIMKTFINRKVQLGLIELKEKLYSEMIQYNLVKNEYVPDIYRIEGIERPPMMEIPAYREKFAER